MGIADEFEKRLERVVEGVFSKTFKSEVEPSEIGRRLLREMETAKSVSVNAVYVPNSFSVELASDDHERFEGLLPSLKQEFQRLLEQQAGERRWRPAGPIGIVFSPNEVLKAGQFNVIARHDSAASAPVQPGAGEAHLALLGNNLETSWALEGDQTTIGRASSNSIVLPDQNASRSHASVIRRGEEWWVIDEGSTNGTLVNDSLIKERKLKEGDRIRIGSTEVEFRLSPKGKQDA